MFLATAVTLIYTEVTYIWWTSVLSTKLLLNHGRNTWFWDTLLPFYLFACPFPQRPQWDRATAQLVHPGHCMLSEQQREDGMRGQAGLNSYSSVEGLLIFGRWVGILNEMLLWRKPNTEHVPDLSCNYKLILFRFLLNLAYIGHSHP